MDELELGLSISATLDAMKAVVISTKDDYELAAEFLKKTKESAKIVEAVFEGEYRTKYDAYKEVVARKKYYTDMLAQAEASTKAQMTAYSKEQSRIAAEEQRKIQIAQEAARKEAEANGQELVIDEAPPVRVETAPKIDGVYEVKVWKYDIENTDLIPREFLIPDEKKIGAIVRASGDTIKIPGVKVWYEMSLRARS